MSRFSDPCDCPACGTSAPRVMLSVPALSAVSSANRRAHETNERAADSPKRTSTHGPGCGCCSGGSKNPARRCTALMDQRAFRQRGRG
ncbi:hypothetical protein QTO30_20970 [Yoonia sp. GPGPB17]|uniref:hypothetical protein n=1 Tax=Yoonia sp. GPGPB17 TaxID=3026147 RepID=UPI0030C08B76